MTMINFANSKVVATGDGSLSLKHPVHGELFHSYSGALQEAQDLYIEASGFKERLQTGSTVRVLDVGLGLGYNALVTLAAAAETNGVTLELVSLELEPELVSLLASGQAPWQTDWDDAWLAYCWSLNKMDRDSFVGGDANWSWTVLCGDAQQQQLQGEFDFIWQDPFSPEKNPPMWSEEWFAKLLPHTNKDTELLSYSVSRTVKDALCAAGFAFERIPTTTAKRHWLKARPASTT